MLAHRVGPSFIGLSSFVFEDERYGLAAVHMWRHQLCEHELHLASAPET